jgi:hypothetical protein
VEFDKTSLWYRTDELLLLLKKLDVIKRNVGSYPIGDFLERWRTVCRRKLRRPLSLL